ncbi:MAG: nickel ABC transporter permease [Candidatus Entotheonella factor]|uniref:Nickel ABC transporter permease n=1 Tax=Entotheonella factor TaxID=1429438 RepID=W4LET4_ENTF1|nr:MAG: nickel ABC transporter permease [Candidatus Entotheonella factor]
MHRRRLAPSGYLGCVLLVLLCASACFAPWLTPYDPRAQDLAAKRHVPTLAHPCGQDQLGRDLCARLFYGARVSLLVGVISVAVTLTVGVAVGALAGYQSGILDELLMRLTDMFLAFPGILLALAIMAILGPSITNVIIALCVVGWVGYARLTRGLVLVACEMEYVTAARATGATAPYILVWHILPNIAGPLVVQATFSLAGMIVAEAGLSFLGLGVQPPTPSWGAMLNEGRLYLLLAPHLAIVPGVAIMLAVLGCNLVGDGLRDWLDPRGEIVA